MFYIGEYGHMLVASAIMVTFFLGGYNLPLVEPKQIQDVLIEFGSSATLSSLLTTFILHVVFLVKVLFFSLGFHLGSMVIAEI
jgi:NADH-quinone oxidoreductase subunit H